MKKTFSILTTVFAVFAFLISCGGSEGSKEPGSIYGVVTDKATGEQITNAGVELGSFKTVTGSDGQFEFNDISAGEYTLSVTKSGYAETSSSVTVKSGERVRKDIQLEKAQGALRIVDDSGKDLPDLNFGAEIDDVSRQFNIFNDGYEKLEWELSFSADWIKSVSKEGGELKAGATHGIIVKIDRSLLESGENVTTLHVTSNDGNKQLAIKATNYDVVTLDATRIGKSSATLNGELINNDADYTETGFVYGTMATPSFDNNAMTVSNTAVQLGSFGNAVSGLEASRTYYYRAYAKNDTKTFYGETKKFATLSNEYVTLPGGLVVAKKDATENGVNWSSAVSLCDNYTLSGFTDWRLPTKDELVTMYNNKNTIGGFKGGWYWSSTTYEYSSSYAYYVDFSNGNVNYDGKSNSKYVRCVRGGN